MPASAVRPLTCELQEIAINELNEVPDRIQAEIDHIREWISKQPHLKARTDDQLLLNFLRGCKFSLQRTKEKLDSYYTAKTLIPEFYANRDPFLPDIQELLRQGAVIFLPKTAHPSAPRICICRSNKLDPEKISLISLMKVATMLVDILLMEDDNCVVSGFYSIVDLKNFSYTYASQLTMDICKKIIMCTQDARPLRMKEVNFLNTPSVFVAVYSMCKMLLIEKLRNRVFFHTEDNIKNFFISKAIPFSILPKDYGGEEVSCDEIAAWWKSKVESYRDWFLEDVQYYTDESKRPGTPKTAEEIFGVHGSFMKLEVD